MSDTNIQKSFIIRRLRNGDTVYLVREITNEAGDGAALLQTRTESTSPTSPTYSPDWSDITKQPIITLSVLSSNGISGQISDCTFSYDGTELSFMDTAYNDGWHAEVNAQRFASKIENGKAYFRPLKNLSEGDGVNKELSYTATGQTASGASFSVSGRVEFLFPAPSEGAAWVQIMATHTALGLMEDGSEVIETTLSLAHDEASSSATADWYKSGQLYKSGLSPADTLKITRSDVEGSEVFSVILSRSGAQVARDGIAIYDIRDEYLVSYKTTGSAEAVSEAESVTLKPVILRNLQEMETPDGCYFTHEIYNSAGELVRSLVGGSGETITLTKEDCKYQLAGMDLYGDIEVRGTATF